MAFETSLTFPGKGQSDSTSTPESQRDDLFVPPQPMSESDGSSSLADFEANAQAEKTESLQDRHVSGPQISRFSVRQFFEGVVTRVDPRSGSFLATITDRTDHTMPDEAVEIDRGEVDEQDWDLIASGACFYWYIGYETASGGRRRVGEIRFRRLPRLTESELLEGRRRAASSRLRFE